MQIADFRPTRKNLVQFAEFLVGGAVYFWVGYVVFAICYSGLGWNWVQAKVASDVIGLTLNYFVQRYWAFNNKGLAHHEGSVVGRYGVVTFFNLAIDYTIVGILNAAGISPYAGKFISAGFTTIWNYLWYRFWVFYQKRKYNDV